MKLALASVLVSGVAAFTSQAPAKSAASLEASRFADELGVQKPLGFFDPLGVMGDEVSDEKFAWFRQVEITHGRVAMLAFLGQIVTRKWNGRMNEWRLEKFL